MEKRTMRDYVYLTPSVLRHQLAGQWEEPLAAAFAARPVRILRLVASGSSYNAAPVRPPLSPKVAGLRGAGHGAVHLLRL
ncbi:MAG: hypothetical protein ACLS3F_02425 [Oscillospiraceae bacterium]